jgi:hypothetical protein
MTRAAMGIRMHPGWGAFVVATGDRAMVEGHRSGIRANFGPEKISRLALDAGPEESFTCGFDAFSRFWTKPATDEP